MVTDHLKHMIACLIQNAETLAGRGDLKGARGLIVSARNMTAARRKSKDRTKSLKILDTLIKGIDAAIC